MAITQISKIQHRRIRKDLAGVPQLASAELAWAIDTQELYIGNGSVAEGAPSVGNTKVLTEHDNILDLASLYEYRKTTASIQTGNNINNPTTRTLQDRLDDVVSVKAFGANGDNTDQTSQLQLAINTLYTQVTTSVNEQAFVVLHLEPGIYKISSPLLIPPNVTLVGAGIDKTIIQQTENYEVFITTTNLGQYDLNNIDNFSQSYNIKISDMTLKCSNSAFSKSVVKFVSTNTSLLENVKIQGPEIVTNNPINYGITFISSTSLIANNILIFDNLQVTNFTYGIYSDYDIKNILISNSRFDNLYKGIVFGLNSNPIIIGQEIGPKNVYITNSMFDAIFEEGIYVEYGTGIISTLNKFYNVGNNGVDYTTASFPIINYKTSGNESINDIFERDINLIVNTSLTSIPSQPAVKGNVYYKNSGMSNALTLIRTVSYLPLLKFPFQNSKIIINYINKNSLIFKSGIIEISINANDSLCNIVDTFDFIGDELLANDLSFNAQLYDIDYDSVIDTVILQYKNTITLPNGEEDSFVFWVDNLITI